MKACLEMTKKKDMVSTHGSMEIYTKEISIKTPEMDKAKCYGMMAARTKVSGPKAYPTEKVLILYI